ncbi:hypothetical protein BDV11DRAFT_178709 [Aspergillus similis]
MPGRRLVIGSRGASWSFSAARGAAVPVRMLSLDRRCDSMKRYIISGGVAVPCLAMSQDNAVLEYPPVKFTTRME